MTQAGGDLGDKDPYHPNWAQAKVHQHAEHFANLVEGLVVQYHGQSGRFGIIASNYDSELFGRWWFEGIDWLREVLRRLSRSEAETGAMREGAVLAAEFYEQDRIFPHMDYRWFGAQHQRG